MIFFLFYFMHPMEDMFLEKKNIHHFGWKNFDIKYFFLIGSRSVLMALQDKSPFPSNQPSDSDSAEKNRGRQLFQLM